jgi:metal-responsive CopG/Arc/MetJ family transcriptional regulator
MGGTTTKRRTHVVLPEDLLAKIDELVGKRERSRFIAEVLEAEVRRRRQLAAIAKLDGALAGVEIPGWETPESTIEWIRAGRRGDHATVAAEPVSQG